MKIQSSAFSPHDRIPVTYSQFGDNISPPLEFSAIPPKAKSLVLIVDDPDAPRGTFTHWIAYNLPPVETSLPAGAAFPASHQGRNDRDALGYVGPKPPDGEHRYFFRLYALDCQLDLTSGTRRHAIDVAMKDHVLEQAELMGVFAPPV